MTQIGLRIKRLEHDVKNINSHINGYNNKCFKRCIFNDITLGCFINVFGKNASDTAQLFKRHKFKYVIINDSRSIIYNITEMELLNIYMAVVINTYHNDYVNYASHIDTITDEQRNTLMYSRLSYLLNFTLITFNEQQLGYIIRKFHKCGIYHIVIDISNSNINFV